MRLQLFALAVLVPAVHVRPPQHQAFAPSTEQVGPLEPASWVDAATSEIRNSEYHYSAGAQGVYSAPNRSQGLRSRIHASGLEVSPREGAVSGEDPPWTLQLRTRAFGRVGSQEPVNDPTLHAQENRVELRYDGFGEWYVNDERGIEQGWTIPLPPAGPERAPIWIEIEASGLDATISADDSSAAFVDAAGEIRLRYHGLHAWDGNRRDLHARLIRTPVGLVVEVEAAGACYPLTIDPILTGPVWTGEGNQEAGEFGYSVSGAGDVNADGFDDVVVGATLFNNGQTDEGRAFVFLGSPSGPSATAVWTAEGDQTNAEFGFSVSGAGDVNGDGFDDVIVGAPFYSNGVPAYQGRAFVFLGSPTGPSATAAWTMDGVQGHQLLGVSVSGAGDVNGDGFDDVIVGASLWDGGQVDEGLAVVYLGSPSGLTGAWSAESDQAGAIFGTSVSGAGDVNGDGFDDVIVGAPEFDNGQLHEGRAYVYLGSASGPSTTAAWTAESDQAGASFGSSVSGAGDVNGDGFDDVIVSAPFFDNGQSDEGRAFVFLGSPSGPSATAAWTAETDQGHALLGRVSGAGNVNGDLFDDVIVGAMRFDDDQVDEGRAFVFLGSASGPSATADWTAESDQADAQFGFSVSGAGDVTGDGFDDVIVGAYHLDDGQTDEGRAYVYLGHDPAMVTAFCFGDGAGTPCPCSNAGSTGNGCANGTFASGGNLWAIGDPNVSNDTLALLSSASTPFQPGSYFQGDNAVGGGSGIVFGDGLRCAGGNVVRLETRVADSNGDAATTVSISTVGGVSVGDTKRYQYWYRDPHLSPCGTLFNLSNGVEVVWGP